MMVMIIPSASSSFSSSTLSSSSPPSSPSLPCSTMAMETTFHSMSHEHKTYDDDDDDDDDDDNDKDTINKNDIIFFKRNSSARMIVKLAVLVVAFLAAAAAASVFSPTKTNFSIAVGGGGMSNNKNNVKMDKDDYERESSTIHNGAMNYLQSFSLFASLFNNDYYKTQLLRKRTSRKLQEGEERGGRGRGEEEEEYHPGAIYTCSHFWLFGPQYDGLGADLFPEYRIGGAVNDVVDPTNTFTKNDIIMTHPGYDCDSTGLPSLAHPDLRTGRRSGPWDFPGKILYVNGEWHMKPHLTDKRDYHLGYIEDDERSRKVYWISIVLQYGPYRAVKDAILDPNKRPTRNTGKYFLLYVASNCMDYRDEAFDKLSQIDIVHYGGECHGNDDDAVVGEGRKMKAPRAEHFQRDKQGLNSNFYHDYRFSLVMESKYQDGYISEKILNVFYAGSIPIWYGTTEIFDVINPRAFVYYDVNHPREALNRVAYLERNQSAYEEMLNEPILADESLTIAKYFSLSDDVGHGILKTRIRRMMDLPEDALSLTGSQ